jgi:hypothetical protein
MTVILLDALNTLHYPVEFGDQTGPTRFENLSLAFARRHLLRFIEDVQPRDPIAIYSLGKDLRVISDFSGDPNRLRQALADYRESSITNAESAEPAPFHSDVRGDFNAKVDCFNGMLAAQLTGSRAERTISALASIARRLAPIPGRKNLVWLTANLPISPPLACWVKKWPSIQWTRVVLSPPSRPASRLQVSALWPILRPPRVDAPSTTTTI